MDNEKEHFRRKAEILFSDHAAKDKKLTIRDVDLCGHTIRYGKVDELLSRQGRVCFKNYFNAIGMTYFVITEFCAGFIKVITVIKKKGKY